LISISILVSIPIFDSDPFDFTLFYLKVFFDLRLSSTFQLFLTLSDCSGRNPSQKEDSLITGVQIEPSPQRPRICTLC
jgi:hypothetical protein